GDRPGGGAKVLKLKGLEVCPLPFVWYSRNQPGRGKHPPPTERNTTMIKISCWTYQEELLCNTCMKKEAVKQLRRAGDNADRTSQSTEKVVLDLALAKGWPEMEVK